MISAVPKRSAVKSTTSARQTCFCGLFRSATIAANRARSAAPQTSQDCLASEHHTSAPPSRESSVTDKPLAFGLRSRACLKIPGKVPRCRNRGQRRLRHMAHSCVTLASLLHPKSAVFAVESSCFAVESSAQIARVPKRYSRARTYPHRTSGSHEVTRVTHRVRTALRQEIENCPGNSRIFPGRTPWTRARPPRPMAR